jgi:hypothetical protein
MKTKVRKKDDVDKTLQERDEKRQKKQERKKEGSEKWFKHWEKEDDEVKKNSKGGMKKPKPFKITKDEE